MSAGPLEGVRLEASLRFVAQWGAAPDRASREQVLQSTLQVLEAVNAMEEPLPERRIEDAPWHADIVRIDRRLNLLLAMVARLLAREESVDHPQPVRIHSDGISWRDAGDEGRGTTAMPLVCLVYLPAFPSLPVALPAEFRGQVPGDPSWVYARFLDMNDAVSEQLDRLIFRHHRRSVAGQRHPAD